MRVGIGITANDRPQILNECLQSIYKHTDMSNVTLYVADDTADKKGVAIKKNECLRALKDCDHIFLFDDDCYPIKYGWVEFFTKSGYNHLLFLDEKIHNKTHEFYDLERFKDCGGVFMYINKVTLDRVGAFNEKFTPYAFEHCEYSIRILGGHGSYPMLKGTDQYLFAHDYSTPNHKSSISDLEKQKHIKNNWDKFFNEPIKNIYLPL